MKGKRVPNHRDQGSLLQMYIQNRSNRNLHVDEKVVMSSRSEKSGRLHDDLLSTFYCVTPSNTLQNME